MSNKVVTPKHVLAILSCAFMAFVSILTETSLNVTFPTLMKEFKVGLNTVQWTTTGYLLMIAIIMVSSSYLNERFSARELFLSSAVAFIIGSLIAGLATNFSILLIGRLISSFGAGLSIPLLFNLVVELMPRNKWGFYMGIAGLVIVLAPTLGPTFGGTIIYYFNWRLIFHIVVVIALLVLTMGFFTIEKYHEQKHPVFDWGRYLVIALAMIVLSLGLNQLNHGLGNIWFWLSLLITAILLVIFVRMSKTSTKHLIDLKVFQTKSFIFALIAYLGLQFINLGTSFVLPNYVQIVDHASSLIGGLILLPGSIIAAIFNPLFGHWYDSKGGQQPLYTGTIVCLLGCLCLMIFGMKMSAGMITIFFALMMIGRQMAFNNTMAEGMKEQTNALHTDATAVFETGQQYAGSIGTTITAAIVSAFQRQGGNYAQLTARGTQMAFLMMTIITIIILLSYYKMFHLEKINNSKTSK